MDDFPWLAQNRKLRHAGLARAILDCAGEVHAELGAGFLESVYARSMMLALRQKGLDAESDCPIRVMFRGRCVGEFYADLFVEARIIVELKAARFIAPEHQAQVLNYLNATGIDVGLLINFGKPKLEIRRLFRPRTGAPFDSELSR